MADSPDKFDAVAAANELGDLAGFGDVNESETAEYIGNLEAELGELRALVAKRETEVAQANARAAQAHAEIEAASKRLANASAKELERRTHGVLESFLPVLDDFDRAIAAARQHVESADVVEGLALVRRSLLGRLAALGVTQIGARGEVFDPQRHDAIALVPVTDPAQDGRVIDVMREGYLVGDKTLRPAGVAVGKRR